MNDELKKVNTKKYMACQACKAKLGILEVGSGEDFLGFSGKTNILWCENKECKKFGDCTLVGIEVVE